MSSEDRRVFTVWSNNPFTDMEPLLEEAYYIQACCWLRLGDIDRAYATLKRCTIQIETPSRDTLCLYACAATRLHPPRYMEGVDSLTSVLKTTPKDFEAVRVPSCTVINVLGWSQFGTVVGVPVLSAAGGPCCVLLLPAGMGAGHQGSVLRAGLSAGPHEGAAHAVSGRD